MQLLSDSPVVFLSSIISSLFISPVIILIYSCDKPAVLVLILSVSFFLFFGNIFFRPVNIVPHTLRPLMIIPFVDGIYSFMLRDLYIIMGK